MLFNDDFFELRRVLYRLDIAAYEQADKLQK